MMQKVKRVEIPVFSLQHLTKTDEVLCFAGIKIILRLTKWKATQKASNTKMSQELLPACSFVINTGSVAITGKKCVRKKCQEKSSKDNDLR